MHSLFTECLSAIPKSDIFKVSGRRDWDAVRLSTVMGISYLRLPWYRESSPQCTLYSANSKTNPLSTPSLLSIVNCLRSFVPLCSLSAEPLALHLSVAVVRSCVKLLLLEPQFLIQTISSYSKSTFWFILARMRLSTSSGTLTYEWMWRGHLRWLLRWRVAFKTQQSPERCNECIWSNWLTAIDDECCKTEF
jgi:hypothetical protein